MAPDFDPIPSPTAMSSARISDLDLAARLAATLVGSTGPVPEELIQALCCSALESPEGCFVSCLGDGVAAATPSPLTLVGPETCFAAYRDAMPLPWRQLFRQALETGLPVVAASDPATGASARMGVTLRYGQVPLGMVGVAGRSGGYGRAEQQRFAEIAGLLAHGLHVRQQLQERQAALARTEAKLAQQGAILDQIHDSVLTMDLSGFITGWNKGAERLFGYAASEAIGRHILFLYADEREEDRMFNAFLEGNQREFEVRGRHKNGAEFWASITLSLARDAQERPHSIIGYLIDITDQLAAQEKLRLHARIFEQSSEGVVVVDNRGRVVSVNRAFSDITGFAEDEVLGQPPRILESVRRDPGATAEVEFALATSGAWQGELWDERKSGERYPAWVSLAAVRNAAGEETHRFFVFSDLTERKAQEQQIYRLAYYDSLTGLPNRSLLFSLLAQALVESQRRQSHGALLFIDLNRFKTVNDSYGHAAADYLLRDVAERLTKAVRAEDVVSRLGGDEFVIALLDIAQRDDAARVAYKVLDALHHPFQAGDGSHEEVRISAAIGIALFPDDGRDAETLLRHADVAMYRAKQSTADGFLFYSQEMNRRSRERLKLEGALRRALEQGELSLHFQPQLCLTSHRVVGAEALLRWRHPEMGPIPPAEFIPLAEETGLIIPIGQWVINAACAQARAWQDQGLPLVRLAVNLSSRQFQPGLPQQISDTLARHRLTGDVLELEITESMLMHNSERVVAMMEEFQQAGLSLSLDDFGTGYSSLAYLKRFPIDNLKIDQSFVRGLPEDANDSAIARAIIGMAKALKLCVIAEGVETEAQLRFLAEAGCDEIQGYHFSPPLPADEFAALLARVNGAAGIASATPATTH